MWPRDASWANNRAAQLSALSINLLQLNLAGVDRSSTFPSLSTPVIDDSSIFKDLLFFLLMLGSLYIGDESRTTPDKRCWYVLSAWFFGFSGSLRDRSENKERQKYHIKASTSVGLLSSRTNKGGEVTPSRTTVLPSALQEQVTLLSPPAALVAAPPAMAIEVLDLFDDRAASVVSQAFNWTAGDIQRTGQYPSKLQGRGGSSL